MSIETPNGNLELLSSLSYILKKYRTWNNLLFWVHYKHITPAVIPNYPRFSAVWNSTGFWTS